LRAARAFTEYAHAHALTLTCCTQRCVCAPLAGRRALSVACCIDARVGAHLMWLSAAAPRKLPSLSSSARSSCTARAATRPTCSHEPLRESVWASSSAHCVASANASRALRSDCAYGRGCDGCHADRCVQGQATDAQASRWRDRPNRTLKLRGATAAAVERFCWFGLGAERSGVGRTVWRTTVRRPSRHSAETSAVTKRCWPTSCEKQSAARRKHGTARCNGCPTRRCRGARVAVGKEAMGPDEPRSIARALA
jgi:hypothetical protein